MAVTEAASAGASMGIILIVWLIVGLAIYLLPSIIALAKRNRRTKVILFNIFLGWTVVMWIISLVWACKRVQPAQPQSQQPQYIHNQYINNQYVQPPVQEPQPTPDNSNMQ